MGTLRLSIAMGDYDRTRPIHDGRVKIDGVDPVTMLLTPEEMFFRAFRHEAFDISELSFSSYCVKHSKGESPYVAVPVFLSRAFRHSSVYIRTDTGIKEPADLKGRRIGVAEWQLTANVWARGILEDYGVKQSDITWVRGGMHTAGRPEKIAVNVPDDVTMEAAREGKTLDEMLRNGRSTVLSARAHYAASTKATRMSDGSSMTASRPLPNTSSGPGFSQSCTCSA